MSWFNLSPATRRFFDATIPPSEITAMSVVPPPISTIIFPTGSCMGSFIPMAAAIGSSTRYASLAPADFAASRTARLSDDNARPRKKRVCVRMDFFYEVREHFLRNFKVGNYTFNKWSHRGNMAGGSSDHSSGFLPNGNDLSGFLVQRDDRWFNYDNSAAMNVDKRIRCAEVDAYVV